MSTESTAGARPATGELIEYKAYTRRFGQNNGAVLYVIATCAYPVAGYKIFFEAEDGGQILKLMEIPPDRAPQMLTYYIASWTPGLAQANPPQRLTFVDDYGNHTVAVRDWNT